MACLYYYETNYILWDHKVIVLLILIPYNVGFNISSFHVQNKTLSKNLKEG